MTTTSSRAAQIRRLEEIGFQTWPAFESERYDGWELRNMGGTTRRNNSVAPLGGSTLPLDEKIAHAEAWFGARDLPTIFRLTQLADDGLEAMLEQRGYTFRDRTLTMVRTVDASDPEPNPMVRLEPSLTDAWLEAFARLVDADLTRLDNTRRLLSSTAGRSLFASTSDGGETVGVGLGIVWAEHVGIYNMNTSPTHSRRGIARAILGALTSRAYALGASTAVLHVTEDNHAGRALYTTAGYRAIYPYWYREVPDGAESGTPGPA